MQTINVSRDTLLTRVRANKEKHLADYNDAIKEYRQQVITALRTQYDAAMSDTPGKFNRNFLNELPEPVSYEKEYNTAIAKLELSADTVIQLEDQEFRQLVEDDWQWKRHFEVTNSFYTKHKRQVS